MDIDLEKRGEIKALIETGAYSQRQIAGKVGVSQSAVCKLARKFRESGSFLPLRKGHCGRKRKLSGYSIDLLRMKSKKDPKLTAVDLKGELGDVGRSVSTRTIQRRLNECGRRVYHAQSKPLLTKNHIRQRKIWANTYRLWTQDDWNKVIFTDESKVEIRSNHVKFVRKDKTEKFNSKHYNFCVKNPISVMLWGCISSAGPGRIHIIENSLNSDGYIEILKNRVIPEGLEKFGNTDQWYLQQDNAPCHVSKKTKEWISNHGIRLLPWCASSPDMSPIENVWKFLKDRLKLINIDSKKNLVSSILQIWNHDEKFKENCHKCIQSMVTRISALHAAKGHNTNF